MLLFLCSMLFYTLLLPDPGGETNDISRFGDPRGGIYKLYQGRIYAAVTGSGYYPVNEADPQTFSAVSTALRGGQAGKDNHHVYCGNLALPGLDPALVSDLGNNYFSDGVHTWHCAAGAVRNEGLGALREVFQLIRYKWGYGEKPQTYYYPATPLPESLTPYRTLLNADFATDGALVYYRGQLMEQAEPATLRQIVTHSRSGDRPSNAYFADGHHVYYQAVQLPLADHDGLEALGSSDFPGRTPYLLDPRSGAVYAADLPFDGSNQPYRLLTRDSRHVYHFLFRGRDGIFYYDVVSDEVKRAGDDPFHAGNFTALSPYVFWNGKTLLYLQGAERWGSQRSPGLISRSTHVFQLAAPLAGDWQKTGDVRGGVFGAIWQNGASFWYFDEIGDTLRKTGPIYRIADRATAQALLEPGISSSDIRALLKQKKLSVPAHESRLEATTRYRETGSSIWALLILSGVLLLAGVVKQKWRRRG